MSNLLDHARTELEIAGLLGDGEADGYDRAVAEAVLHLVAEFAQQGHSGFSASMTLRVFDKVARFEPLTPLTGEDNEWNEVSTGLYQNRRCSHVFKRDGEAYDIEGRIFREPDGATYTSYESRVPVTFPYVPHSEFVEVAAEGGG